jgi:formamidopyrimidine-DNA glycosylase
VPELPELLIVAQKLTERLEGESIQLVNVYDHLVIHGVPVDDFMVGFQGEVFQDFQADGKFLIGNLVHSHLVVNPMLTGRIRLVAKRRRKQLKSDMFSIKTQNYTLWYSDLKRMGRVYLAPKNDFSSVAGFEGRGPSPFDPELTMKAFKERIRRHRGQIKNVLRNQRFLKGIGNAYADEILLYAGILPFRKRSSLTDSELESLYTATQKVLTRILEILSERGINEIAQEKRDFMMVHNRGGGICPLCGGRISEVTANRFKTNYCQTCQK